MAEYSKPVRVFFRLSASPPFFQNFTPVRAAIFVPDDIKHTSHYLGVLLKFAEERREINNMFSAASLPAHLDTKLLISLLLRRTQRVPALGDRSLAEKGSIKISFGVISEVRPREDEEKGKTLEVSKIKKLQKKCFCFSLQTKTHAGQKPQSTPNHFWSLSKKKCFLLMLPELFASEQPLLDFFVIHSILVVFQF